MEPVTLKTSPATPVDEPPPAVITETIVSASAAETNVSFVPAVNVTSPSEDNVPVNCLLTLKLVSDTSELAVVSNVLIFL